ncbi:hypothetical protein BKA56DRAFT_677865 [Ilyonectria sp. MPI-CAGE-AT-0026]|nr:hypothetical protein BKA56DRAFT_677865 [Ilyonectria sp. MPI-CAGE-AT-0026]
MAPDPAPPLPLAANRAALSNRISMLLASQSSVLKTMSLTRPPATATAARRAPPPDEDDFLRGPRPNEGVGYVADAKDVAKPANSREERLLRGKVRKGNGKTLRKEESESEDDVGRSALGKRKRPRREVMRADAGETAPQVDMSADVDMDNDTKGEEGNVPVVNEVVNEAAEDTVQDVKDNDEGPKKKRKRKNKKKKQKTAIAQE